MSWIDWLIVVIPLAGVMWMAYSIRRYLHSVADFLVAGRICGRYLMAVANSAAGVMGLVSLIAMVEVQYKTGFALGFWSNLLLPLGMVMALTGYCTYRFRATGVMTFGQFLELRYSRRLRVFAAVLRVTSEILANMILPALAARFFIYILGIPHTFRLWNMEIPSFMVVCLILLTLAVMIIWFGGNMALLATDTLQGLICYPLLAVFVVYFFMTFSWSHEIVPTMLDRVSGESFLNPYDISNLRDFNLFAFGVTIVAAILHRASWIGDGTSSAAKSPHEQKMAGVLGNFRSGFYTVFCALLACAIITFFNHRDFSDKAKQVRDQLSLRIADEIAPGIVPSLEKRLKELPPVQHNIGVDNPPSEKQNPDTPYLLAAEQEINAKGIEKKKILEFRTLFHQLMLPLTMRQLLPTGLIGAFVLLLLLMMLSTDSSRLFSSAITIAQDVILPHMKQQLPVEKNVLMVKLAALGVGIAFFFGSLFMAQLDYINLFVTIVCSLWMGGCGPVMIFGLYSRFGTTAGAWTSLVSGMFLSLGGILMQRNWSNVVYPFLDANGYANAVGNFLRTVSSPFNPYIVWEMDPVKCPINSIEIYAFTMIFCLIAYCVVSFLTMKTPFDLDKMLHRSQAEPKREQWSFRKIFSSIVGITPEYTKGDKIIAWSAVVYVLVVNFFILFVGVALLNIFCPFSNAQWSSYFLIQSLVIPGVMAVVVTVWFSIGGIHDLIDLFRNLKHLKNNPDDDGRVLKKHE